MKRWWAKLSEARTKWAAGRYWQKQTRDETRAQRDAEELDRAKINRFPPMGGG